MSATSGTIPTGLAVALTERYTIERELGSGGMATVYVAHDIKHDRKVAIKVLHEDLGAALGPERFLAEIKTTAKLQHPHILPLLDSGSTRSTAQAHGLLYYVMPYVEGESLRQRLIRETQLPIDDAVRIAREVADALGHAHGQNIVHRDIKPENILLRDGHALVADFGIALAVTEAGGTRLTQTGLSVGTPTYMSPEQAAAERGVDHRADVYALGVVLYEMLAGQPPFTGATAAAITARKLTETAPPLRSVRNTVPAALEQVVRKAMARTPADRFATARQFAEALELVRTLASGESEVALTYAGGRRVRWPQLLAFVATALLGAGLAGTLVWRHFAAGPRDLPSIRFAIRPPPGDSILMRDRGLAARSLSISPDGRLVTFVGVHGSDTVSRLHLRDLASDVTVAIAGTEGARSPFFKPDGEWIGYIDTPSGKLMKVPTRGGQPQVICDCRGAVGADWGNSGWIIFDEGSSFSPLRRVREGGGRVESLPLADSTFSGNVWNLVAPQFLPGERAVLVTTLGLHIGLSVITIESGKRTDVVADAWSGRLVDRETLVYARKGELWAVRFDPRRLEKSGEPVRVVDSVESKLDYLAEYAVSTSGTLVYSKPLAVRGRLAQRLVWVDRQDRIEPLAEIPGGWWMGPRLSPDGSRIMFWGWPFENYSGGRIWLFDRSSRAPRALTDDAYTSAWPIFSGDGRSVVANSSRNTHGNAFPLWSTPTDGGGLPAQLTALVAQPGSVGMQQPSSISPDGQTLAFQQFVDPRTGFDLYLLSLTGDRKVRALLVSEHNERLPVISPDGRWIAYVSDESGRDEVYARRYPEFGTPLPLSIDGGDAPAWSVEGRELYFARESGLFTVSFLDGRAGAPHRLINGRQRGNRNTLSGSSQSGRNYDVARDGRFLMIQQEANYPNGAEYQMVLNWLTDVRARMAQRK